MRRSFRSRQSAFTLIELLIVVAIIGILAAIAVPNMMNAQTRAQLARVAADLQAVTTALEAYCADHGSYPVSSHSANDNLGFRRLTTPIAYINGYLKDPFSRKYVPNRENRYDLVYEFNTGSFSSGSVRPSDRGYRGQTGVLNVYEVESLGPDGYDDYISSFYPSHHPNFQFFDVTNGLVSKGDILRAGGIYLPRWYRERQGGPNTTGPGWM